MTTFYAFISPSLYLRVLSIHNLLDHFLPWNKPPPTTAFPGALFLSIENEPTLTLKTDPLGGRAEKD
jgi:hypothetical protein